MISIWKQKP